jgi:hypothetical protein
MQKATSAAEIPRGETLPLLRQERRPRSRSVALPGWHYIHTDLHGLVRMVLAS